MKKRWINLGLGLLVVCSCLLTIFCLIFIEVPVVEGKVIKNGRYYFIVEGEYVACSGEDWHNTNIGDPAPNQSFAHACLSVLPMLLGIGFYMLYGVGGENEAS